MARLVLVALFLISASPPKTAGYERCIMVKGPPHLANFCILTDWLNPVLEAIGFWPALERLFGAPQGEVR